MKESDARKLPDEITRPAHSDSVTPLVEFVSTQAWEAGFDDERIKDIGLAVKEAVENTLHFAGCDGSGDIRISCTVHDSGAFIVNISDTGAPFNMLLASTFPEAGDFVDNKEKPSTKLMKKGVKNIEYRRDASRNILIFTVPRLLRP